MMKDPKNEALQPLEANFSEWTDPNQIAITE
jgi:hypothetical protein